MNSFDILPNELILAILLETDYSNNIITKIVLCFVCKQWRDLVSDDHFIKGEEICAKAASKRIFEYS